MASPRRASSVPLTDAPSAEGPSADAAPADATPADVPSADAIPADAPPAGASPADAHPADVMPAGATSTGAPSTDAASAGAPPAETPPTARDLVSVPYTSNRITPAPWLSVPARRFVCIEHPAVVRNVDRAIATVGGEKPLAELAASNGSSGLALRFRGDPMSPPIESRTVPTDNILLKITLPRRRRKRKEGRDATPDATSESSWDNKHLLAKLQASKGNFQVEAMGLVERTVRFRDMANYQWNSTRIPFVNMMNDTILTCDYDKIRDFKLSPSRGVKSDADIIPPPAFSNTYVPHTYNYRQNPAIKKAVIGGKQMLLNVQAAPKTLTPVVPIRQPGVPSYPPIGDKHLQQLDRECVDLLRELFKQRPIWSRRALYNHIPKEMRSTVRFTMVHVAYMFRSGPWRDTCITYGIDPRLNPKYRKYQSLQFQMSREPDSVEEEDNKFSHIFDGKRVLSNGRCVQLCDITDPLVKRLIDTEKIRSQCDMFYGWYRRSTMQKIKAIMKGKFSALREGRAVADSEYLSILELESESEEQERERKIKEDKLREERASKRRLVVKRKRHGIYDGLPNRAAADADADAMEGVEMTQKQAAAEDEDGEFEYEEYDDDEEREGEWDEALDVDLSLPGQVGGGGSQGGGDAGAEDDEGGQYDHLEDDNDGGE